MPEAPEEAPEACRPTAPGEAPEPRRAKAEGGGAGAPGFAHIVIDDVSLERTLELELPPEPYYEALAADMLQRHRGVCPHVVEHLVSVEALLHVALVTGFSFGVPKSQVLQHSVTMLGEVVGRTGREASLEHVEGS